MARSSDPCIKPARLRQVPVSATRRHGRCCSLRPSTGCRHHCTGSVPMQLAHVVLLGDSILDNDAYTGGAPDVITHLRSMLPSKWQASLAAVDGSTTADLGRQLAKVPRDATHLVVAIGGND